MSSVYLPPELKKKLTLAARRRGFQVGRGPASQLAEYIAYLVDLDEQMGKQNRKPTLEQALGLLVSHDGTPPDDDQIEALRQERRMSL